MSEEFLGLNSHSLSILRSYTSALFSFISQGNLKHLTLDTDHRPIVAAHAIQCSTESFDNHRHEVKGYLTKFTTS